MGFRELFPVHEIGQHHFIVHGPFKWNAVMIGVGSPKNDVPRGFSVGPGFDEQFLERNSPPNRIAQTRSARQGIDADERRNLVERFAIQDVPPPEHHGVGNCASDHHLPLLLVNIA